MSSFQGHAHSLIFPYTKTNQICGLGNQELDPKLAYNMELANSALHVSCVVGKKKPFWTLVAKTETGIPGPQMPDFGKTRIGTVTRLLLELEPQHRASLFLEPRLKYSCNSFFFAGSSCLSKIRYYFLQLIYIAFLTSLQFSKLEKYWTRYTVHCTFQLKWLLLFGCTTLAHTQQSLVWDYNM